MDSLNMQNEANRMIKSYTEMRERDTASSMYQEAMWQYAEMAHGGNGGPAGAHGANDSKTIRSEYYPDHPNEFFFLVLSGLGEFERYLKTAKDTNLGIP